jgi:hypothetical protein
VTSDDTPTAEPETAPKRQRSDKTLVIVSLLIAIGLVLVTRGILVSVTGDERAALPSSIESVLPVPDAEQALAQTDVFVDLASGLTGVLVIDGIEIDTVDLSEIQTESVEPGEQVAVPVVTVFEPGNYTLTYAPSPDGPIDRFGSGSHRVDVIYWPIEDGRERARVFTWFFNVV